MLKTIRKGAFFLILMLLITLPCWVPYWIQIYVNLSDSLPHKIFISFQGKPKHFSKGMYVVFRHPEFSKQIIKRIEGIPGDQITRTENGPCVQNTVFPVKSKKPMALSVIPPNYYFVAGSNPNSYDSRYEQFGLVHIHQIQGGVWPII